MSIEHLVAESAYAMTAKAYILRLPSCYKYKPRHYDVHPAPPQTYHNFTQDHPHEVFTVFKLSCTIDSFKHKHHFAGCFQKLSHSTRFRQSSFQSA